MSKPDFAEIEVKGAGEKCVVSVGGKILGHLFEHDGVTCVRLWPQVVKSIGRKDIE